MGFDEATTELNVTCPFCCKKNELATNMTGGEGPEPGDVSLCIGCTRPSYFTEDMGLRKPTEDEYDALMKDEGVVRMIFAMSMSR